MYIKEDVHYKTIKGNPEDDDLQSLTIEIGLGRERKTVYSLFYHEWTGGVSQLDSQASQLDRQARQVAHWMTLNHSRKKDIVIMGDANICARKWNDDSFDPQKKQIANLTQEFLLEETFVQLVSKDTRSELVQGAVQSSLIDHIYTNSPGKCETPTVHSAGNSDHLAIMITKYTRELKLKPQTVKKRSYKNFDKTEFLCDVRNSNINDATTACDSIEEATEVFQNMFEKILNKHAPIKVFQIRNNYVPYLSEETKLVMAERDALKEEGTENCDEVLLREFRQKRNEAKKMVEEDKKRYFAKEFNENQSSSNI